MPPMADCAHVDGDPGLRPLRTGSRGSIKSPPHTPLDLDAALAHLWAAPHNPKSRSDSSPSFSWWRGKIGGDCRSFVEVAATPPRPPDPVDKTEQGYRGDLREGFGAGRADRGAGRFGRGGGRFDCGASRFDRGAGRFDRGTGRFDRGGGRFSWRRDGTNDYTNKSGTSETSEAPRWDAATAAAERQSSSSGGVWVAKNKASADSGGGSSAHQPKDPALMTAVPSNSRAMAKSQVPSSNSDDLCPICKVAGHAAVRCSLAFCERCNKLGHLASVCIEFLPWECIAPMCVFQARGAWFLLHP